METGRVSNQSNPPAHLTAAQQKSGEEAFHDFAKSKGNSKEELALATSERTRLTRTRRVDRADRKKTTSLFLVTDDDELQEEPVYRTVMVDGILFTLRLLAVA